MRVRVDAAYGLTRSSSVAWFDSMTSTRQSRNRSDQFGGVIAPMSVANPIGPSAASRFGTRPFPTASWGILNGLEPKSAELSAADSPSTAASPAGRPPPIRFARPRSRSTGTACRLENTRRPSRVIAVGVRDDDRVDAVRIHPDLAPDGGPSSRQLRPTSISTRASRWASSVALPPLPLPRTVSWTAIAELLHQPRSSWAADTGVLVDRPEHGRRQRAGCENRCVATRCTSSAVTWSSLTRCSARSICRPK